jgi:hypothetical protein
MCSVSLEPIYAAWSKSVRPMPGENKLTTVRCSSRNPRQSGFLQTPTNHPTSVGWLVCFPRADSSEEGQTVYQGSPSTCLDPHFPFLALLCCAKKKSFSLLLGQTSYVRFNMRQLPFTIIRTCLTFLYARRCPPPPSFQIMKYKNNFFLLFGKYKNMDVMDFCIGGFVM